MCMALPAFGLLQYKWRNAFLFGIYAKKNMQLVPWSALRKQKYVDLYQTIHDGKKRLCNLFLCQELDGWLMVIVLLESLSNGGS